MATTKRIHAPSHPRLSNPSRLLFKRHLEHLQLALHPLLSVANGQPHPSFPASILHYHLLTEAQLDDLAHWYHQRTPSVFSFSYPAPVTMRWERTAGIEDKRRRFGRFIGLRGCESPRMDRVAGSSGTQLELKIDDFTTAEEMKTFLEARIRRSIHREQERDIWRRKGF